jgi:hypothetical protein
VEHEAACMLGYSLSFSPFFSWMRLVSSIITRQQEQECAARRGPVLAALDGSGRYKAVKSGPSGRGTGKERARKLCRKAGHWAGSRRRASRRTACARRPD